MVLSKILLSLWCFVLLADGLLARSPGSIAQEAVSIYQEMIRDGESPDQRIREIFSDLDGPSRIEEILIHLRMKDESFSGTPYEMPIWSVDPFVGMLRRDPDLVEDIPALREMIASEESLRDFYFLTKIAMVLTAKKGADFSKEMRHMLLREGKIANVPRGKEGVGYDDITSYTYGQIMTTLNRIGVDHPFKDNVKPNLAELKEMSDWLTEYHGGKAGSARRKLDNEDIKTLPKSGEENDINGEYSDNSYKKVLWTTIFIFFVSVVIFFVGRKNLVKS